MFLGFLWSPSRVFRGAKSFLLLRCQVIPTLNLPTPFGKHNFPLKEDILALNHQLENTLRFLFALFLKFLPQILLQLCFRVFVLFCFVGRFVMFDS